MTEYKTSFDVEAWKETGQGYKVEFYDDGSLLWHRYCADQAEVDEVTGDICHCGCADFKEYSNHAGTFRQCHRCFLARMKPKE